MGRLVQKARQFGQWLWHRVTFKRTRELLKHIMTDAAGDTYVPGRVLWVTGALQFHALSAWSVIAHKVAFDPMAYAGGLSAILVAGGAGVWMASKGDEK